MILAGEFSVKVEIEEGARRKAGLLKRPLGDISARGAGGILYWGPLGPNLGRFGRPRPSKREAERDPRGTQNETKMTSKL